MSSHSAADSETRRSIHSDSHPGSDPQPPPDGPSSSIFDDDDVPSAHGSKATGDDFAPAAEPPPNALAAAAAAAPEPVASASPAPEPSSPAPKPTNPAAELPAEIPTPAEPAASAPSTEPAPAADAPAGDPPPFFLMPPGGDSAPSFFAGLGTAEAPPPAVPAVPYPVLLPYVEAVTDEPPPRAAATAETSPQPTMVAAASPAPRGKAARRAGSSAASATLFYWLVIYAIFSTICLIYVIVTVRYREADALENLPDVVPDRLGTLIDTSGKYVGNRRRPIAPYDRQMPRGHTLRLGETQQYAHLKVTPLKVTRGPLRFKEGANPFDNGPPATVLKLWLRFENASADQTFAPLDTAILAQRGRTDKGGMERANNFVARQDARMPADVVLMFDPSWKTPAGWNLGTADAPRQLAPGESVEVYVPTNDYDEEQLKTLTGPLVWRLQFRKGIADTGRGVTTLIEIPFDSQDIQDEPAAAEVAAL